MPYFFFVAVMTMRSTQFISCEIQVHSHVLLVLSVSNYPKSLTSPSLHRSITRPFLDLLSNQSRTTQAIPSTFFNSNDTTNLIISGWNIQTTTIDTLYKPIYWRKWLDLTISTSLFSWLSSQMFRKCVKCQSLEDGYCMEHFKGSRVCTIVHLMHQQEKLQQHQIRRAKTSKTETDWCPSKHADFLNYLGQ